MKYIIKIPEPCHEDWSKMTSTEKGKFCASCKKEVFDFTNHSNYELVRRLNRNESICGRFRETQLNKEMKSLKRKNRAKVGIAASFMAIFSTTSPAYSQGEPIKLEVRDTISDNLETISKKEKNTIIKGIVSDEIGPLPGVSIVIKGTHIGTETDFDGNFTIEIPSKIFKKEVILVVSFIGLKTQKLSVTSQTKSLSIILKDDPNIEQEFIVAGWVDVYRKPSLLEKIKDSLHIKKIDSAEPVKLSQKKN